MKSVQMRQKLVPGLRSFFSNTHKNKQDPAGVLCFRTTNKHSNIPCPRTVLFLSREQTRQDFVTVPVSRNKQA